MLSLQQISKLLKSPTRTRPFECEAAPVCLQRSHPGDSPTITWGHLHCHPLLPHSHWFFHSHRHIGLWGEESGCWGVAPASPLSPTAASTGLGITGMVGQPGCSQGPMHPGTHLPTDPPVTPNRKPTWAYSKVLPTLTLPRHIQASLTPAAMCEEEHVELGTPWDRDITQPWSPALHVL